MMEKYPVFPVVDIFQFDHLMTDAERDEWHNYYSMSQKASVSLCKAL